MRYTVYATVVGDYEDSKPYRQHWATNLNEIEAALAVAAILAAQTDTSDDWRPTLLSVSIDADPDN